jgi:hypothetical protein
MANQVTAVSGIAIGDIETINGKTDDNIAALRGREFTGVTDAMTLLGTVTGSNVTSITVNDSTLDSGIDSTYDYFVFEVVNAHSHTNEGSTLNLQFAVTEAGGDGTYDNINITSAFGIMYHDEDDSNAAGFGTIDESRNAAQVAGYVNLTSYEGNDADQSSNGRLTIWGLGSGTYEKNFISEFSTQAGHDAVIFSQTGGVIGSNDATAIDDVNFKFSNSNISATIRLWGWAKS